MARLISLDGTDTLDDILAPDLDLLFCGYNPSLYAVEHRHYYARKANRFWEELHEAGLTPSVLRGPGEDERLPAFGLGVTDLVKRASPNIDGLTPAEFRAGCARLDGLLATWRPRILCFNGLGLLSRYRAWGRPPADVAIYAVPSTSPRNNRLAAARREAFLDLAKRVAALRAARAGRA